MERWQSRHQSRMTLKMTLNSKPLISLETEILVLFILCCFSSCLTIIASLFSHLDPEAVHARQLGAGAILTEQSVRHRDLRSRYITIFYYSIQCFVLFSLFLLGTKFCPKRMSDKDKEEQDKCSSLIDIRPRKDKWWPDSWSLHYFCSFPPLWPL